jgi:hypothetical protein
MMLWNDAADRLMLALWTAGNSLRKVAAELCDQGYNVTRNSVVGRKYRLKEQGQDVGRSSFNPSVKAAKKKPEPKFHCDPADATVMKAIANACGGGVDYMENENGCRAILDKRGGPFNLHMVCGLPRTLDAQGSASSYCETHHVLYNTGPSPIRRMNYG